MNSKIYYPTFEPFLNTSPVIYDYLLYGFSELGHKCVIDETLDKDVKIHVEKGIAYHITPIDILLDNKKIRCWFDWSDFHWYYPELRNENDFYFKLHFTKELYNYSRTYPIGQTVGQMSYIKELKNLRKIAERPNKKYDLIAKYRTTNYDVRLKAVELLKNSKFNVITGLKDFNAGKIRPFAPKEHKIDKLTPYLLHMKELAESKFGLALPAVDNSRAWKHTEIMGLGIPLIALDLKSILPGDYQDCYIKIKNDLSDLIEKLEYYSNNYEEARKIGENGRNYFNKWLSPKGMANNIMSRINNEHNI